VGGGAELTPIRFDATGCRYTAPQAKAVTTLYQMLATSTWGRQLPQAELDRVYTECSERRFAAGDTVAAAGDPSDHWIGLIEGLGKMSVSSEDGRVTTLAGISSGAWFGEGSLLKRERRRYDAVALRASRAALMPAATFMRLRERSLPFNHYLQSLMNARLGWFIALLVHDRLHDADARIARCLASLFNPDLYPDPGAFIDLRQHEVGLLCGTSRQRTNAALHELQRQGLVRIETRGLTVLDLDGLRCFPGAGGREARQPNRAG
jgi:CRP-like cAMP-binding protein